MGAPVLRQRPAPVSNSQHRSVRRRRSGADGDPPSGVSNASTRQATRRSKPGPMGSRRSPSTTPGWHRIKATELGGGKETAIRSNRLDVCVAGSSPPPIACRSCPPTIRRGSRRRAIWRKNRSSQEPKEEPTSPGGGGSAPTPSSGRRVPAARGRRPGQVGPARLDKSQIGAGVVGVSWQVQDAGAGIARWTVSSKRLGRKGARFVTRASGKGEGSAQVHLPRGARYLLRLTVVDLLGHAARASISGPSAFRTRLCAASSQSSFSAGSCSPSRRARRRTPPTRRSLDKTVRYLQEAQQAGRRLRQRLGRIEPDHQRLDRPRAGGGRDQPADQRRPGGADAFSYLVANYHEGVEESECAPVACTTTLERELMVVNAAGANPHDFAGVDLAWRSCSPALGTTAPSRTCSAGSPASTTRSSPSSPWRRSRSRRLQAAIRPARRLDRIDPAPSGGWAWSAAAPDRRSRHDRRRDPGADRRRPRSQRAVEEGIEYLRRRPERRRRLPRIPRQPRIERRLDCLGGAGDLGRGREPRRLAQRLRRRREEPLAYMESLQEPDGHIRWKQSEDLNGIWMTAYCSVAPRRPELADPGGTAAPRQLGKPPQTRPGRRQPVRRRRNRRRRRQRAHRSSAARSRRARARPPAARG